MGGGDGDTKQSSPPSASLRYRWKPKRKPNQESTQWCEVVSGRLAVVAWVELSMLEPQLTFQPILDGF
jgi:hypothetical protein